jgi:segregation and condensation protein B
MTMHDLIGGLEAILFASAQPMTEADLRKVVARWLQQDPLAVDAPLSSPAGVDASVTVDVEPPIQQTAAPAPGLETAGTADGAATPVDVGEDGEGGEAALLNLGALAAMVMAENKGPRTPTDSADADAADAVDAPADPSHAVEPQADGSGDALPSAPESPPESLPEGMPESPVEAAFDWRKNFKAALAGLRSRWQHAPQGCGFNLVEVAEGLTFRSNARFAGALLALRDDKPQRLSRPAMETLAIVAYRQPVTKPEADHIRGVDCGGTIKMLLDRNLLRIVGKKDEPGRPLLYGTTPEFLSFFNLRDVDELPSLRTFEEVYDDSEDALRDLDALPSLQELSASAKQYRLDDEPAMGALDDAVEALRRTEVTSRDALAAQGIALAGEAGDGAADAAASQTRH